jgi:hypothetical protein
VSIEILLNGASISTIVKELRGRVHGCEYPYNVTIPHSNIIIPTYFFLFGGVGLNPH